MVALEAAARESRIRSLTAEQFMDLTIIHELSHSVGRDEVDLSEAVIWEACFKW